MAGPELFVLAEFDCNSIRKSTIDFSAQRKSFIAQDHQREEETLKRIRFKFLQTLLVQKARTFYI
jgi:hypothetical protein